MNLFSLPVGCSDLGVARGLHGWPPLLMTTLNRGIELTLRLAQDRLKSLLAASAAFAWGAWRTSVASYSIQEATRALPLLLCIGGPLLLLLGFAEMRLWGLRQRKYWQGCLWSRDGVPYCTKHKEVQIVTWAIEEKGPRWCCPECKEAILIQGPTGPLPPDEASKNAVAIWNRLPGGG